MANSPTYVSCSLYKNSLLKKSMTPKFATSPSDLKCCSLLKIECRENQTETHVSKRRIPFAQTTKQSWENYAQKTKFLQSSY